MGLPIPEIGLGGPFPDRPPISAVLLADGVEQPPAANVVSVMELCAVVLASLQQYGSIRDLEYDDFPSS
jgi:hypothetical protein